MTPIDDLPHCSAELSLSGLARRAREFLGSHRWCRAIRSGFLAHGWDGALGLFLFDIDPEPGHAFPRVWVICGDVPPAWLACEDPSDILTPFETYIYEMRRWVLAVRAGRSTDDLLPVCYADSASPVPPTLDFAALLARRLEYVETRLLPDLVDSGHRPQASPPEVHD